MISKEELNALEEEGKAVSKQSHVLTDEELEQVSGGEQLVKTYTDENGEQFTHTSALCPRLVEVH